MTRVAAYYDALDTSTKACPIGKTFCWHEHRTVKVCRYYQGTNSLVKIGPVTVLCSAPTTMKEGKTA